MIKLLRSLFGYNYLTTAAKGGRIHESSCTFGKAIHNKKYITRSQATFKLRRAEKKLCSFCTGTKIELYGIE